MHTTTLTPYALSLMARKDAAAQPAQSVPEPDDFISSEEFARLSGYSRRHIQTLCDEGFFVNGVDFKQRPPKPGSDQGGRIRIRKAALKKLES